MIFVWGSKWKYKVKPNGLHVEKYCSECHIRGEFFEVVPTKYFTAYWIPLFPTETKESVLECPNCHEHLYIQQSDYLSAMKKQQTGTLCMFICEGCGQKLRVPQKANTIKVTCPSCRDTFNVRNGRKI